MYLARRGGSGKSNNFLREDGPQILKSIPRELCGTAKYHYPSCQRADWIGIFGHGEFLCPVSGVRVYHQDVGRPDLQFEAAWVSPRMIS